MRSTHAESPRSNVRGSRSRFQKFAGADTAPLQMLGRSAPPARRGTHEAPKVRQVDFDAFDSSPHPNSVTPRAYRVSEMVQFLRARGELSTART